MDTQALIDDATREFVGSVNVAFVKHMRLLREIKARQTRLTAMLDEAA